MAAGMGYDVAVNFTSNADKAAGVVEAVEQAGQRAMAVQADVSQVEQVEAMFAAVDLGLGTPDALINNAGIGKTHARIEDTLPQDMVDTFAVNVFGVFYCSQAAVRRMSTRHGGKAAEIANAIVWLMSDEASYVTGSIIDASGGRAVP